MVTLHLRLEQFISGFKIFGVAIWAQVTLNVLDALFDVTTPEIIDKIHDMVMDDRNLNNGLPRGNLRQKRRRPFLRPERLWRLSFGIRKE
uniref:Uncharacterized protein n=1 Tax=Rhodnius prolixus TaxID=13249 RepID=T1I9J8_RHOPR